MGQTTPSTTSDEWKGLTSKPHPEEPPSDEVNRILNLVLNVLWLFVPRRKVN